MSWLSLHRWLSRPPRDLAHLPLFALRQDAAARRAAGFFWLHAGLALAAMWCLSIWDVLSPRSNNTAIWLLFAAAHLVVVLPAHARALGAALVARSSDAEALIDQLRVAPGVSSPARLHWARAALLPLYHAARAAAIIATIAYASPVIGYFATLPLDGGLGLSASVGRMALGSLISMFFVGPALLVALGLATRGRWSERDQRQAEALARKLDLT